MQELAQRLLDLPGWQAACLLSLLPLLESSTLVGIVLPGETGLVFGGALVYYGRIEMAWMLVAGALATVIGDSLGYLVGRRWGKRLMATWLARRQWTGTGV